MPRLSSEPLDTVDIFSSLLYSTDNILIVVIRISDEMFHITETQITDENN